MWRELLGLERKSAGLVDLITPQRSFHDVVLPDATRQQLFEALTQIEKHRLIFQQWGLGERHPNGTGLVFNFAGPPGTGKTICAEAVAYTLDRKLLRVNYSELESCWVGETSKNLRQVFRDAKTADAVLFFDEADSMASRRFSNVSAGSEREANQSVNVLLKEVEEHEGVVIFATNMASNFDPAFERRIRTHILFHPPGAAERERIWQVQVHPDKTPLAADVNFQELAARYELTGGDIRNAVLKAAQMAAAEPGADNQKCIRQNHFMSAVAQVRDAQRVMQQGSMESEPPPVWHAAQQALNSRTEQLEEDLHACRTELGDLSETQKELRGDFDNTSAELTARVAQLASQASDAGNAAISLRSAVEELRSELDRGREADRAELVRQNSENTELSQRLLARLETLEARLQRSTVLPWSRSASVSSAALIAIAIAALGGVAGHFLIP